MVDQLAAGGAAPSRQDIDHTFRIDVLQHSDQLQRGQRGQLGWLQHHRTSGGQRRCQLPCGHHQRVVPWRNTGDNTNRITPYHRGIAFHIFTGGNARHAAHSACHKAENINTGIHLFNRSTNRLARIERFQTSECLAFGFQPIGQFVQQCRPVTRCACSKSGEGFLRRPDGSIDLFRAGLGNAADSGTGCRVDHWYRLAVTGHDIPVDQKLGLVGHLSSPHSLSENHCLDAVVRRQPVHHFCQRICSQRYEPPIPAFLETMPRHTG